MRPELDAWKMWRDTVPADIRDEVADALMLLPVDTYSDLNAAIRYLMSETVRGTIHPDVMQLAIRCLEFMAVTVAARQAIDGTADGGMRNLVSALKEARKDLPKLEARFTSDHPIAGQVIDVVPAKRA